MLMLYVFLNPIAAPITDTVSFWLVLFGVVFLIAAVISVVNFALKSANKRYEEENEREAEEKEKENM